MKNDFFVTVSDGNGGEQVILIWVPLAILAHNVVLENGGTPEVAHKASLAVIHHGKEIDYKQKLTVRRQVIMSARKAADAVIDELGNGDVAAAVLEAVREGGETLFSSKASGSGIVLDEANSDDRKNKGKTPTLIKITLERPMGIVFEPIGDPQECSGVRILELTRGGKAHLSQELKVGDELLSMNGTNMTNMTFYDVVKSMSKGDAFDMTFKRPNKRGLGFSNLMKRNASKKGNKTVDQRENEILCQKPKEMPPPSAPAASSPTRSREATPSAPTKSKASPPTRSREVTPSASTKSKAKTESATAAKKNSNKRDKHEVEKREREAASQQEKLDSSSKSASKKSNPREVRAVSLDIKSNSRRSPSKKGSHHTDKRDDEPPPRQVKSNPDKKNSGRKGIESTDKRDKRVPIHDEKEIMSSQLEPEPEPVYEPESEPARVPASAQPDTETVRSYDSMASIRSSFDFFGFWPSSSRSKPEVSSATQEYIEPEHPYHPSHLIPGWTSSGASTISDADNSSKALSQYDLSQLWGNENSDHGRLAPAQEENSLLEDESYREEESYREDQLSLDDYSNSYATSCEDNPSWTDDCSTAASSYYSEDVSTVRSRRKKFRPIKQLRKRFMM